MRKAVAHVVGELADTVIGVDSRDQIRLDATMQAADATNNLGRLGANAILPISVATALAAAACCDQPLWRLVAEPDWRPLLPMPMVNILSGRTHGGSTIDMQDFLAVPVGAVSFSEAIEWAWRVRTAATGMVSERGLIGALIADEGGLGPALDTNREALELLTGAIERAGLKPREDVAIAIDVAASQLVERDGTYRLGLEERTIRGEELIAELVDWAGTFPIVSIEDPLAESDWDGWANATRRLKGLQVVGDDLFSTNPDRLARGIELDVANAVLIKPNQIGTLSATREAVDMARNAAYATIVSARSGDTEDAWLADLAVGWRSGQIKVGSIMRSERTAKWNRILGIEAALGADVEFAGRGALAA